MSNAVAIIPQTMSECNTLGKLMATAQVMIPQHLQGRPADCTAVAMQAAAWGMNPYTVAQKTHIVSGKLGYEAQLVNSVISSSTAIQGRFKYEVVGDWSKIAKKNWLPAEENGLGVRVGAVLHGEEEVTWGDVVYLAPVAIRNSPLWKTNPLQQLKYLALKYWARIYTPDVIMGVYTRDELVNLDENYDPIEREINETPKAKDLNSSMSGQVVEEAEIVQAEPAIVCQRCGFDKELSELKQYDGICGDCYHNEQEEKAAQVKAAKEATTRRRAAPQQDKAEKAKQPEPKTTKAAENIEEAEYTEVSKNSSELDRIIQIKKEDKRTGPAYKEAVTLWKNHLTDQERKANPEIHSYLSKLLAELKAKRG